MKYSHHTSSRHAGLVAMPACVVLFALFLLPFLVTMKGAFKDGMFFKAMADGYTRHVLSFTLKQALLSTLASLAIGLPGAWLMKSYDFPGKRLVRAVSAVPFALPSILVVLGFVIFYGNNGILNRMLMKVMHSSEPPLHILYSLGAIILAHAFYNFPLVMQLVSTFWSQMDPHPEQAALTLGASRPKVFLTITIPRLLPMILSASTLVFLYCYNSFSVILVLGGGPAHTTMETEIYRYAKLTLEPDKAAAFALMSLTLSLLILMLYLFIQKKLNIEEAGANASRSVAKRPRGVAVNLFVFLFATLAVLFVLGPIISVVWRSFTTKASLAGKSSFTLKWYLELFGKMAAHDNMRLAFEAMKHSFSIASLCALATMLLVLSLIPLMREKGTLLELLCMLPIAVSGVMIGLGYLLLAVRLGLIGYPMVVLAHLVMATPVAIRTVLPAARKIPQHYLDAAHTLGARNFQVMWGILIPLLIPNLLTAFAFAFAMSLGEMSATLTLSGHGISTIPTVMYQLIGSYNFQGACALGSVLIASSVVVFLLGEFLKGRDA